MAQITISVTEDLDLKIRQAVVDGGYSSVSAYISETLNSRFKMPPLDYWTRVGLVTQLENNRLLHRITQGIPELNDEDWSEDRRYDALTNGYEAEYSSLYEYIYRGGLSAAGSKYVIDVLAMYEHLQWSYRKNSDTSDTDDVIFPRHLIFNGFDGNNEYDLLGYVRHLVKNNSFAHVKAADVSYNSHAMQPDYRAMLSRYDKIKKIQDSYEPLSSEQISTIVGKS